MKHLTRIYRWIEGRLTSYDQYHDSLEDAHEHIKRNARDLDTVKIYNEDREIVHSSVQGEDTYA